ncbi:hypothetical protein [Halomonas caseinilytica]|uniref:hypothetical protein n=1 Tax=Halomonas caseinilytica TaxID=438744 RepID=UPI0007E53C95|nr:hypothetical protein [Halomonas caseinilytica]SEN00861.1 hypothetical protein SAMN04487952_10923 [Halomonas caseinilytica]
MSERSPDKFARITAVISLVIAIAAVAIPYVQQKAALMQQQEQFDKLHREDVSIKLNPYLKGVIYITGTKLERLGSVVQVPWELTISNTGSRQLSIKNYDLTRGDSPGTTFYSDIDGGLLTLGSQPVGYPIILKPGEMRKFLLFVGITVPDKVVEILKGINEGDNIDREVATAALAKEGLDLYGNEVSYKEFEGGAYFLSVDEKNMNGQRFWCVVHTGRGNSFVVSASEYERPSDNDPLLRDAADRFSGAGRL